MPTVLLRRAVRLASAVTFLVLSVVAASAGDLRPGRYRGVYRVDRWGQGTFSFLFVNQDLRARMRPFSGVYVEVDATSIRQLSNPGAGEIRGIGNVTVLPCPMEVTVQWSAGAGPAPAGLKQVAWGTDVVLSVRFSNRGDKPVRLGNHEQSPRLRLRIATHHLHLGPNQTDINNPVWRMQVPEAPSERLEVGYWSSSLRPADSEIDFRDKTTNYAASLPREQWPTVAPGQTISWTLTLRGLPANEYELTATGALDDGDDARFASSPLLLDIIGTEVIAEQGLQVGLARSTLRPATSESIPLTGTLRNVGVDSLHLGLWSRDFDEGLSEYDREGHLLRRPRGTELVGYVDRWIDLKPGEQRSFEFDAEKSAALVRWVVRYWVGELGNPLSAHPVYLVSRRWASPHVLLPR